MKNPCSLNDILKSAWILLLKGNVKDKEKICTETSRKIYSKYLVWKPTEVIWNL